MMNDAVILKLNNNIDRIIGAILLGKELNPPNRLKWPCSVCNRNCLNNQDAICCDSCDRWCHISCDGTSVEQYRQFQAAGSDHTAPWYCLVCTVRSRHETLPFTACSLNELVNMNKSDNLEFCHFLPSLEIIHESSSLAKYSLPDPDCDLPNLVNSKYHSVSEFQNLKIEKNFNIFHSNVNGLESN